MRYTVDCGTPLVLVPTIDSRTTEVAFYSHFLVQPAAGGPPHAQPNPFTYATATGLQ